MKSTIEKLSPTRAKLTITVPADELKPSITHAYSHIAEQINTPDDTMTRWERRTLRSNVPLGSASALLWTRA